MRAKALRAKLPMLIGGAVLLLLLGGLIWMIKGFIGDAEPPAKRQVQQISLVKPPPPKVEEKPPEEKPPEVKEEVPMEQPNPEPAANNEPPPGDEPVGSNLGPGNDGFGLGKGSGTGRIGGGGSRLRWYTNLLATEVEQALNRDSKLLDELKSRRLLVKIWVGTTGHVERVELERGSLPVEVEERLRNKLIGIAVAEAPNGVAQPIWYRFRPRG